MQERHPRVDPLGRLEHGHRVQEVGQVGVVARLEREPHPGVEMGPRLGVIAAGELDLGQVEAGDVHREAVTAAVGRVQPALDVGGGGVGSPESRATVPVQTWLRPAVHSPSADRPARRAARPGRSRRARRPGRPTARAASPTPAVEFARATRSFPPARAPGPAATTAGWRGCRPSRTTWSPPPARRADARRRADRGRGPPRRAGARGRGDRAATSTSRAPSQPSRPGRGRPRRGSRSAAAVRFGCSASIRASHSTCSPSW